MKEITVVPQKIFTEYRSGTEFKASVGKKGIFEQAKINERFYAGDHWYGAKCGNDRPLVRRNLIRRIADYKLSTIGAAPIAVNFSAEGVPDNTVQEDTKKQAMDSLAVGESDFANNGEVDELEVSTIMQVLTDYGTTAIERLKFDSLAQSTLKNAYVSGTGILYTYWDELTETGMYADAAKNEPIRGDIACQVLDVENVVFGDANNNDVQNQPYIIISQRRMCDDVRREARRNRRPAEEIENIKPDNANLLYANAGTRGEEEPSDSQRITVLTKFYKEWDDEGKSYKVMCVRVTEKAVIRKPWDIGVKLYPLSKIVWDERRSSAYGDSEITYLIPNQIAVNRALTAQVWAMMATGMPILIQNGDVINYDITNEPGQIIKVYGANEDVAGALRFLQPPAFAGQMITSVNDLANNTLTDTGANDAALGNVRPDNATAIIQIREAALQPMQIKQNQYYAFIEDTMRIWAEFWLHLYGDRNLKINTASGTAYVPFHAKRYEKILVNAKVDVGASTLWSTSLVISTLDALLQAQIITPIQYLERMPSGFIPDKTGLIEDIKEQSALNEERTAELSDDAVLQQLASERPELYQKFQSLPPEQRQAMLQRMRGGNAQ